MKRYFEYFIYLFAVDSLLALVAWALWNWIVPNVFNGPFEITYLQMWGVLIILKMLRMGSGFGSLPESDSDKSPEQEPEEEAAPVRAKKAKKQEEVLEAA